MSSFLTQDICDLLRQVHEAIADGGSHDRLASIRDEITTKANELSALIRALDTIEEKNTPSHEDPPWSHSMTARKGQRHQGVGVRDRTCAKHRQRATQARQMQLISTYWSLDVLTHYGRSKEALGRDGLDYMVACAKAFPRFEPDVLPQANLLRFLKHCAALYNLSSSKEGNFAGFDGKFQTKDLKSLRDIGKGKPLLVYGREVTLDTASHIEHEIRQWTQNQSGVVIVKGTRIDLKEVRPRHWKTYLLKFDERGLLVQRGD